MAKETGIQCNLNDKIVRSFGTLTCNIKPATRDKCVTSNIVPEHKNFSQQTIKGYSHHTVYCQTTCGSITGNASSVACQTGIGEDHNLGYLQTIIYALHNDDKLTFLNYQLFLHRGLPCLHVFCTYCMDLNIFPGFPCQLFFVSDGQCFKYFAMKQPEVVKIGDDYSVCAALMYEMTTLHDSKLCAGFADSGSLEKSALTASGSLAMVRCSKSCSVFINTKATRCNSCKQMTSSLKAAVKRKLDETPTRKLKRARPGSKCRFSYLTPRSKKRRLRVSSQMKWHFKQKVNKLTKQVENRDLTLGDEQHSEMVNVTRIVKESYSDVVDSVISNATEVETERQAIRQVWERDCSHQHAKEIGDYQHDQNRNNVSGFGNRWSPISYRIALAVYSRSPAAYRALSSFNIIKLPSINSVKNNSMNNRQKPGICHDYLQKQYEAYEEYKAEKVKRGDKKPQGIGVLIFDEVKVIDKLLWNSKNHAFVGVAMEENEYAFMRDVFLPSNSVEPQGAEYVLQFLWRDLTAKYDVIGPYFMSSKSVDSVFVTGCLFETMRAMHAYDFKVLCLVCDGAPTNLTVLKSTLGITGAFGIGKHAMPDIAFDNPFARDMRCHWIICPAHQLKNMVSALHSSRPGGTKNFVRRDVCFGWQDIVAMKAREDERCQQGQLRFVSGLLQSYIDRDSWTRLNVKPSKIFQQDQVLQELFNHANCNEISSKSTQKTFEYLMACNKLFEQGFMNKKPVFDEQSPVMANIEDGFQYFESWLAEIKSKNPEFALTASQSPFIAWQTYDLLRVCVFGLRGLVHDFKQFNDKGYFLVLSRITGSAVESLFSQMKYAAGGKLSSVNFASASNSVAVSANITSKNAANRDCRDTKLYV